MVTVEGLRLRLGLPNTADNAAVLELVLADTLGSIRTLTGIKRFRDDLDGDLYAMAMDVYRSVGYGQATAPAQIASVKDKDQTVQFRATTATGVLASNHNAVLRRIRKLRW